MKKKNTKIFLPRLIFKRNIPVRTQQPKLDKFPVEKKYRKNQLGFDTKNQA